MLKKIFLVLVALVAVFVLVVSRQPSDFKVTRSATMAASADKIFPHVNNLSNWAAWSPWAKLDPNAKETLEGPAEGVGAIMRWDGNYEVGKGSMTISESRANEFIKFEMEFLEPMKSTGVSEFSFKTEGDKTTVTWSMYGKNDFLAKAIGLIMNCEKMVGDQFDQGLESLRKIVEVK